MSRIPVKKLVLTAVFSALTFIATMIIQIPTPTNGYINLGDSIVLVSAYILGPVYGGFAAGVGSALADLIAYPFYAPATFVIKFFMAFVSGLLFKLFRKHTFGAVICGLIGELIMISGYFLFEAYIIGLGWFAALSGISSNIFQAIAGLCSSVLLIQAFTDKRKKPVTDKLPDEEEFYEEYEE